MDTYRQNLILDNINLAYKLAWKYYNKFGQIIDIEELKSISIFSLVKAANTFVKMRNIKFSTYAYTVIKNDLITSYNEAKKYLGKTISLYTEIDDNRCLEDLLYSDENVDNSVERNFYSELLYKYIDELLPVERKIMYYTIEGLSQTKIAKRLNLSDKTVSMHYRKAMNKLRYKFFRKHY